MFSPFLRHFLIVYSAALKKLIELLKNNLYKVPTRQHFLPDREQEYIDQMISSGKKVLMEKQKLKIKKKKHCKITRDLAPLRIKNKRNVWERRNNE